jgi:hypothetical protein
VCHRLSFHVLGCFCHPKHTHQLLSRVGPRLSLYLPLHPSILHHTDATACCVSFPTRAAGRSQLPVVPRKSTGRAGTSLLPAALSLPVSATGLVATLKGPGVRADGSMKPRGMQPRDPYGEKEYRGLDGDAADELPCFRGLVFSADSRYLVASTADAR